MGRGLGEETKRLIVASYTILEEQHPQGVRATCYQLFNQKLIPDVSKKTTDRMSGILTTARERDMIPWAWISDEKREFETVSMWDDPADFMETVRGAYRKDRWAAQPYRLVVVSEKERGGTLRPVTKAYGVPFVVYSGFTSATAAKKLAEESVRDNRPFVVLYVGDLDPSGCEMSDRDLPGRIARYGGEAEVVRVALLPNHIREYGLGPNTFDAADKESDSRYRWYVGRYGNTCVELDALPANDLRELVEDAIYDHLDVDAWEQDGCTEEAEMTSILGVLDTFKAMRAVAT
jgi:hypothetical protein